MQKAEPMTVYLVTKQNKAVSFYGDEEYPVTYLPGYSNNREDALERIKTDKVLDQLWAIDVVQKEIDYLNERLTETGAFAEIQRNTNIRRLEDRTRQLHDLKLGKPTYAFNMVYDVLEVDPVG